MADQWDAFPDAGGTAVAEDDPFSDFPDADVSAAASEYVPAELQQFEDQQAIERKPPPTPEWLKQVVPQALKFPGKVALAAGGAQHGKFRWPTDEEVQTPALSPTVSRAILGVTSGGLTELARDARTRFPKSTIAKVASGVTEGVTDAVTGFSTPENLALLPLGGGKVAQRLIAGVFLGQAIKGTPEQWEAFNDAPDLTDKIRIATAMGLGYGLPMLTFAKTGHDVSPKRNPPKRLSDAEYEAFMREVGLSEEANAPKVVEPVRTTKSEVAPPIETEPVKTTQEAQQARIPDEAPSTARAPEGQGVGLTEVPYSLERDRPAGPQSLEEAQGLPANRGISQRFKEPEGAPVSDPSQTTAAITRNAVEWRNALMQEGEQLGKQVAVMRGMGQPIPKPLADRIAEINSELKRGYQPPEPQHYELRGDEPIEPGITSAIAEIQRRNSPATEQFQGVRPRQPETIPPQDPLAQFREQPEKSNVLASKTAEPSTSALPQSGDPLSVPSRENTPTSTRNATTTLEREARGIPEAEQAARRDFGTVWDEAAELAAKDVEAPRRLVAELAENPHALTDKENALLLRRQIEVQNEHSAAIDALNTAPDDAAAILRLETARNELQAVYDAGKAAGTETGRGLNARKMLANQDFTLAKMEAETRAVVNQGKPLSPKQANEVRALHQRITKAEDKLAAYEGLGEFRESLQTARKTRDTGFDPVAFMEARELRARERIASRRSRMYSDPLGVTQVAHLADEAIIGAAHIARGLRNFKEWSQAMAKDFGDGIKPYLKALFAKAQSLHSETARVSRLNPEQREANALAGEKKGIVTRTEKLQAKTEAGNFEPAPKKQPRMDKEKSRLLLEYQQAKEAYMKGLFEAKQKARPFHTKAKDLVFKTVNTSRAIKTSFDVSAVGRQGGFLGAGHPIMAARNIKPMLEALKSEEGQFRVESEIKAHSDYALAKQSKLELTETTGNVSLTKTEEAYMNSFADKIPGVAASQRAYVTYLNKLRMDAFSLLVNNLGKKAKATPDEARIIANYVNVATGRGYVGKHAATAASLNNIFFAPRYVLSRFQLLLGQPLVHNLGKGSPRVRALIAKEYARSLTGTAAVLALGITAGATFETDNKRSPDFLKLKFGNTRLDPLYGLQQTTVFLNRLGYNLLQVAQKKKVDWNDQRFAGKFLRSKLAPAIGSAYTLASGTDYLGQPASFEQEGINSFTPLAGEGIIEAMQEQGIPKGTALSMLSLLGMGLQTYESKKPKNERRQNLNEAMRQRRTNQVKQYLTTRP